MSQPWQRKLEQLQSALQAIRGDGEPQLHHAMLLVRGPVSEPLETVHPRVFASRSVILDRFEVRLSDELRIVHFVFTDYRDDEHPDKLRQLKHSLWKAREVLDDIPARLMPKTWSPTIADGKNHSFAKWLSFLQLVSKWENQHFLRVEFEYAADLDSLERTIYSYPQKSHGCIRPWDEVSHLYDTDVLQLLTLHVSKGQGAAEWQKAYYAANPQLPKVLAASLTKPLLYLFVNAIDLLCNVASQEAKESRRVVSRRFERSSKDLSHLEVLVLALLRSHHGTLDVKRGVKAEDYEEGGSVAIQVSRSLPKTRKQYRTTPLSQKQVLAKLNANREVGKKISQPTLCRTIHDLFVKKFKSPLRTPLRAEKQGGMSVYRTLCETDRIVEALEALGQSSEDPLRAMAEMTAETLTYGDNDDRRWED
ncbi:MAG: hypothetical protein JNL18_17905 [Planctomycetaceae bacterium]|nr:hypothetical protein [Planctomycetaceae bacterium]